MLEGLVTWVLNNYVGEYLENLNADQISVALLQGQVELENVPLRKTALQKFDIPLEVRSGVIGKLTLSIPITHIKSEPWVLKISDLLVLLGPNTAADNVEVVEQYEQTRKEQMLEELEKLHKKQLLTTACLEPQVDETQAGWWGASLVSAVSNNIQLILDNVHIRYEDDQTMPDKQPFSFGFRIQNISIQTTNAQWKPGFIQPDDGVNIFKKLDIKGFSVFWNCAPNEMHKDIKNLDELKQLLCPLTTRNNTYILQPFSMQVRMEKNTSKFPLKQQPAIPRFKFDLRPETIELELSKRQLAQIQVLTAEWSRFDRARQHRKWRPLSGVTESPKEWWRFAYWRILEQTRRQRTTASKDFVVQRAKLFNNYCRSYRRRLRAFVADEMAKQQKKADPTAKVAPTSAASQEDVAYMKQIEHDSQFSYAELHLFRETIFRRYIKELETQRPFAPTDSIEVFELVSPESEPNRSHSAVSVLSSETQVNEPEQTEAQQKSANSGGTGLYGWISSWFGGTPVESDSKEAEDRNKAALLDTWSKMEFRQLPPNLRKIEKNIEAEILDVLSESWDDSTTLRRDSLLAELVFQLEKMIIRFVDDDELLTNGRSRVLALDMRQLASRVLLSPREHRTEVMLSVGEMSVQRLRIAAQELPKQATDNDSLIDKLSVEDDSLFYGSSSTNIIEPEVLFAIGRTKEAEMQESSSGHEGSEASKPEPLLQLFYRRLAPRMNIFHEVKASLLPVSIVYDEDALDGLSNLFDTESAFDTDLNSDQNKQPGLSTEYDPNVQLFLTINVPEVHAELRTKRLALDREVPSSTASAAFVNAKITNVSVGVARTERFLTKMKLGFDNIVVNDMYEKTDWPLLKTVPPPRFSYTLKARSNSSPDISSAADSSRKLSTSLPMELRNVRSIGPNDSRHSNTPTKRVNKTKKNAQKVDNDFGHWDSSHALLNFTFVDEHHPKFEKAYNKQHCLVKANLSDVEVGMNRRTWTMLLNFFGALGQRSSDKNKESDTPKDLTVIEKDPILEGLLYGQKVSATELADAIKRQNERKKKVVEPYILRLLLEFAELTIHMNYPTNNTRLGHTSFSDVDFDLKANLTDFEDPMRIALKIAEFSLLDSTPFYSRLYNERLSLKPHRSDLSKKPKLSIDVLKYRTDDLELKRKFDILVNVSSDKDMSIHYVHTHRYLCAFIDFWLQFADLQDQVRRLNEQTSYNAEAQKTRCKLTVDLETPLTLILPLNQFCDEIICLEASSIKISNMFLLASQIPALAEHAIEVLKLEGDDYDCLMESMRVECANVCVRAGLRHSTSRPKSKSSIETDDKRKKRKIGETAFENFWFEIDEQNILNREFQLTIDVYRNLSAFISHNLPDLAIITHFEDLDLAFTTDFYCLLRGFLEKNLGDQLIPVPETIPLELLQSPDRAFTICSSQKYITFSHRMVFKNVKFNFLFPSTTNEGQFDPFGVMVLHKARISFDAYIDNQSEFDLVCESTELTDTRYDHLPKNQRPNIFQTILSHRKRKSKLSSGNRIMLMSEAHILMRKDEPPIVTLVLMNSRVLLILDWLNQAKDFVCMNTSFVPPEEHTDQQVLLGAPKDGVLVRNLSTKHLPDYKPPHTITLKITLKESDLLLLEDSSKSNSLALVGHTTAVLNLNDASGVIESNFEIQNMSLSWCLMSAEQSTSCQISNEFNLTVAMVKDVQLAKSMGTQRGLSNLYTGPRQALKFEIGEVVCRMSYKDILVVQAVIQGALKHPQTNLSRPQHSSARNSPAVSPRSDDLQSDNEKPAAINIRSVSVNAPNICAWFLDDSQGVALPLIRLILTNLRMHYANEKIDTNVIVGVDYFNQRVFGWEPLIESWPINKLMYQWSSQSNVVKIQPASNCPLNFNVTQTFIQQAKHFFSTWSDIQKSLKTDLRTMCVRLRSDHLLYLIRNETGSRLAFTTDVEECLRARQTNQKANAKWYLALADRSCTFEFPTKLLTSRTQTKAESRQLIIKVDGWDEISPVSVDSVGTYIRIARKTSTNITPTYARLVIDVSMEPNGRKVVVVRSAMTIINKLSDPLRLIFTDPQIGLPSRLEVCVRPGVTMHAPLSHVNSRLKVCPFELEAVVNPVEIKWHRVKSPGDVQNRQICFTNEEESTHDDIVELSYWVCASVKHEMYPEHETPLCGHSICFMPSLSVLNLLPNDIEFRCNKLKFTVQASQRMQTSRVDLNEEIIFSVSTERFRTLHPICLRSKSLYERADGTEADRILMQLLDEENREVHVYASVSVVRGGALNISLWVPFWIVNRSGIPLIIKQESADKDAAGQVLDHEKAKDRNPLMFSFADDACPLQCVVRVGRKIAGEPGFKPRFSRPFSLAPGIQALTLVLTHDQLATRVYNIGVEVRAGTGRYKDTQVVIFAPRYRLNNRSPFTFFVAHKDECAESKKHIELAADCNMIWHENYEDKRVLCIRRDSLSHWSCPFRIDQVGSYHATIRERDGTPRFVCVEITLQNASFWVTFTDASLFPPPISVLSNNQKPVHPIQLHPDDESNNVTQPSTSLDIHLELPAGLGISLVRNQSEELIYALLKGVELNLLKKNNNYQLIGHVNAIQIDNQLFNAERWPVLYCDAYALRNDDLPEDDGKGPALPALKMEISWSPRKHYDAFDCFRLKLCNMCLLLDEVLIWKIIQFVQETDTAHSVKPEILIQPPNIELDISLSSAAPTRRCYFGMLEMEFGDLSLSAISVSKNILPRELKRLKQQFNVGFVNFENALVRLPPFRRTNCFETTTFLIDSLGSFYLAEIRKQTINIVITMDAFGNPLGLVSDLKESFQSLFFEGDFSGFFTGLGYGVSNSLSKVFSSAAQGVGSLTFDEQHELLRRRMLRSQSEHSTPLTHLFGGVKGLGVGVYGLFTSLPKNTIAGAQQEGLQGMIKGVATGAVDSVTKPVQGMLDFVSGATSAFKDMTSGQLNARSHFAEQRTRLPRICTNLQALLPPYSAEQSEAQQELFRIVSRSSSERLLDLLVILIHVQDGRRICHRALICTDQCYITRQVGQESSTVIQRIVYRSLRNIQPAIKTESGLVKIEVVYDDSIRKSAAPAHIWCSNHDVAAHFSDLILTAKQRYDHTRRTLTVSEEMDLYY